MRLALIWLLVILAALGRSADILILIHEREAGPIIPAADYNQPTWILWPHSSNFLQSNRLFSLPSGVDWQTGYLDDAFVVKPTIARSIADRKWVRRGFYEAVAKNLGGRRVYALAPKTGEPAKETLKTAMTRPEGVQILNWNANWPSDALMVAEVTGRRAWDDKAALVRKAGGRAIVVEVPYDPHTMWTRVWLDGKGWPDGTPISTSTRVPGLIPAREAMALLAEPSRSTWAADKREPPSRWLNFGHEVSPVALVFLAVGAIYVIGLGIYCALREQYSRTALILVRLLVIGPAALILGGRVTSLSPLSSWPTWHLGAFLAAFLTSWIVNRIADKWIPDCHPLWGEFAVGMFVCAGIDPVWSMFSNVLGPHRAPISPEAFGALASYAVAASYLFAGKGIASPDGDVCAPEGEGRVGVLRATEFSSSYPRWTWGVLATVGAANLLLTSQWLVELGFAALVLALVVLARNFTHHLRYALPLTAGIGLISALFLPGLAYAPKGLVWTYAQVGKFNCAEQIAFLLSPTFISFSLIAIVIGIVGDNFLGHQARRAMAFSPKPRALLYAAICFAVAGVFIPLYLHAALATAIAGSVAVLFDAIRTP